MDAYQRDFIDFLLTSGALTFGEFKLKSGRVAPYFINTGRFDTGATISALGSFYATHIVRTIVSPFEVIFGPAYKGIPLAVATASGLSRDHGRNVWYTFNRKEDKDHGDTGGWVGHLLTAGERVVMVDDVITAGTTMREILPKLRAENVDVLAVVIAVDRCEKGTGDVSAVQETRQAFSLRVEPIVTIHHILEHLREAGPTTSDLPKDLPEKILRYLDQYGVAEPARRAPAQSANQ